MQHNDHEYLKTAEHPSYLEGQENSESMAVCVEVPEPRGKGQSTPSSGPTERVDPSIVELVRILDDPTRLENLLVEHSLSLAPPPPSAPSSTNGTHGPLEKRGRGRKSKANTPIWGVCSDLGFNPDLPLCRGEVTTFVRKGPQGGRPTFRCRFCRKQISQLRGLPWAKPSSSSSPATMRNFFCNTDCLGRPNAKISKRNVVWIIYCMSKGMSLTMTAELGGSEFKCSTFTLDRWRHVIREAVSRSLASCPRMGGPEARVQVAIFTVQIHWPNGTRPSLLLAFQTESTGELRLVPIQDKAPGSVVEAIAAQVLPETQVVTNGGAPFSHLEVVEDSDGPMRLVHNAGEPAAKKSTSPFFNTQKLRMTWRYALASLKKISRVRDAEYLKLHLDWLSWNSLNGPRHCKDPFLRLLDCIAKAYEG